MSRLQYQCTMSLDGFIAGAAGDMSWLTEYASSAAVQSDTASDLDSAADLTDDLVPAIGAVLVGNRTFRGDDPNKGTDSEGAYGGQWSGPTFVLTHHVPAEPEVDVTFSDDLHGAVAAARAAAGDKIVGVLGADVARQCIEAGLLDELLVSIAPVLLGDGVRLFDRPGGSPVRLQVLDVSGLTIVLRVVR
ncbi:MULTISPECIES: dihydrofolate reductase family protein [Actinoalloteichus]|uniref:Dihydrofolate reductase n=1 Tax=Actinoalloteichus fjordicus TaxID=1612552 RepID=A0AAC9LFZ6_9PSEU|nr:MULTISPECIES: dihydrofolate reductase family protein [Actinoalloteichus]APU15554.1 dihydrofolate reductase [Actinoalloteichus fjordicus]APU21621.1 dihydrofolate reductase [Actinoalloteichus sp. GBA129-24]